MSRIPRSPLFSLFLCGLVCFFSACNQSQTDDGSISQEGPAADTSEQAPPDASFQRHDGTPSTAIHAPLRATITEEQRCGTYRGHPLYVGPKGGCYYYNKRGGKSYVGRENCDC